VPIRGFFILFSPKIFTAKEDKWELDRLENILKGINYSDILKEKEPTKSLGSRIAGLSTQLTLGTFEPVPKEIYEKYLELRKAAIDKSSEQGEVLKIEASKIPLIIKINEMKNLGIANREIAKQLGISEAMVSKYIKLISGSSK
jgi:hypothetical protein